MANKSESQFIRALTQRTEEARSVTTDCIRLYISSESSVSKRQAAARDAVAALDRISALLHNDDIPKWMSELRHELERAAQFDGDHAINAMRKVISNLAGPLYCHEWSGEGATKFAGFDFDAVYAKYRDESRIPELFGELIKCLREIASCDQLDSRRVIHELNDVIATLQRAQTGSYFATVNAWKFAGAWITNSMWEILSDLPIAGSVVKGLRKTMANIDGAMETMHDKVHVELHDRLRAEFPRLEYRSLRLPAPEMEQPQDSPMDDHDHDHPFVKFRTKYQLPDETCSQLYKLLGHLGQMAADKSPMEPEQVQVELAAVLAPGRSDKEFLEELLSAWEPNQFDVLREYLRSKGWKIRGLSDADPD